MDDQYFPKYAPSFLYSKYNNNCGDLTKLT